MDYLVTTSSQPKEPCIKQAKSLAVQYGLRYLPRNGLSISSLQGLGNQGLFLVDNRGLVTFYGNPPMCFHPGMARIRLLRLSRGENDRLIDISKVMNGWQVLDCTAGMVNDASVFKYAVGPEGRVVALESSFPVYLVVQEGIASYPFTPVEREAFRSIELLWCKYQDYLRSQPEKTFDLVYFDPMFQNPVATSKGISPLRQVANYDSLTKAVLEEGIRVTRKLVIVKERKESELWSQIKPDELITSKGSRVAYGLYKI